MTGRPRELHVFPGKEFGVLKVTAEVYQGNRRYAAVVCTSCGRTGTMRVADLAKGQQCKCLTRGRRRGAYRGKY